MQRPSGAAARPSGDVLQKFLSSLKDLHVVASVVRDEAETGDALRGILAKAGARSVVVAGIPKRYLGAVKASLAGTDATFVEDLRGRPTDEAVKVLASADAGVTWAANGVALEGALLEIAYDDSARLASALPIVHVALLESSSILPNLAEALPVVGKAVGDAPPDRRPVVTFISGPSKTGDIEMRLLYGVHGPHTVHALVLDWS
ncbi:MAG TPA: lactate utilization protein [Nitrososphaerales archaeon]|nr:lactate utilization protein [Nitrososphaerales archaeon]HUK75472.1 lactate utilization protein [Nitrososphaerales archaeon]